MSDVAQKRQLMIAKLQLDKLSLFICSLADFYRGVSPKVDEQLDAIQKMLKGKPNYDNAAELSSHIKQMLNEEAKLLKQQRFSNLSQIERLLKQLRQTSADEHTRLQIKGLLNKLPSASGQASLPMPMFARALELFKQALINNATANNVNVNEAKSNRAQERDTSVNVESELHHQIVSELKGLLGPHLHGDAPNEAIVELNQQLHQGLTPAQLLKCCLTLIRFMNRDIATEANIATKLISNIHQSLHSLKKGINTSINFSRERSTKRRQQRASVKGQISALETAISSTSEHANIKQQTQSHLDKLQASIQQHEDDDNAEQTRMQALLKSMQARLNKLEKQAAIYQQKVAQHKLAAKTDELTKLPNRAAYEEVIAELSQSTPKDTVVAVIDIDHFKSINDNYGHSVGDKTLQVIAAHIQKNLAEKDFVCRWGGEEFVALLFDSTLTQAAESLDSLRDKISKLPFIIKGNRVSITVSIGLTALSPNNIEQAFDDADKCLYKAKQNGRNQIQVNTREWNDKNLSA